jgi:hypothetical protein
MLVCVLKAKANSDQVKEVLQAKVKENAECLIAKDKQSILSADIIQAGLSVNLGNRFNDNFITDGLFLKTDAGITTYEDFFDLIQADELLKSINPDFKLKTEEDGIQLRSLFFKIDMQSMDGFFKTDNAWYFILRDFFGEVQGYKVSVDANGTIKKIEYSSDLGIDVPLEKMGEDSNIRFDKPDKDYISTSDTKKMIEMLSGKASYSFEVAPSSFENADLPVNIYTANLVVITKGEYGDSKSNSPFIVIEKENKIELVSSMSDLIDNLIFNKAICSAFTIKNEIDAKKLEKFIDEIDPTDNQEKRFYKQEDVWFFVRENMFDQMKGYLAMVDEEGKIKAFDSSDINFQGIMKLRMKDPSYVVDWAFKKVKPTEASVTVTEADEIPVKITFNADAVNARGAWILTRANGKKIGMEAGTNMESPFTDDIPAKYLGKGTHTVEYILLPPGQNYDDELAKVVIEVVVE